MRAVGAPDEVIEKYQEQRRLPKLEIHPLNWQAVKWFLEVSDQWTWRDNQCLGMDWLAVEAEARMRNYTINAVDFKKLKVMAAAARNLINKKQSE